MQIINLLNYLGDELFVLPFMPCFTQFVYFVIYKNVQQNLHFGSFLGQFSIYPDHIEIFALEDRSEIV